jgi:hypothetical protein
MTNLKPTWIAIAAALACAAAAAQDAPQQYAPQQLGAPIAQPAPDAATLAQLVAPVALYDDALLLDVLAASTYPAEVVEAWRWLQQPGAAGLQGDALAQALAQTDWDPSVQALVPFPQVLQMMNDHLDWTEHLGEAFLANQGAVMDAVQDMRRRALNAGLLRSGPDQQVDDQGGVIAITPPPTEIIAVPSYDPWCVYGPWPYVVDAPFYFGAWDGICSQAEVGIGFGFGIPLPFGWWQWGGFDWQHRRIHLDPGAWGHFHPGQNPPPDWQHDPRHRGGVPYQNPRNAQQFQPPTEPDARGYAPQTRPAAPAPAHAPGALRQPPSAAAPRPTASPPPARSAPPAFDNFAPRNEVQGQAARGAASLGGHGGGASGFGARPDGATPGGYAPPSDGGFAPPAGGDGRGGNPRQH